MNWYLILLFLHIVSAIVLIGGILARQLVRSVAEKSPDVHNFATLSRAAGRIENLMVIPGNLAVIIFGVFLALITGAPIFGFLQGSSQNWLLVSNILLLVGLVTVPLVFAHAAGVSTSHCKTPWCRANGPLTCMPRWTTSWSRVVHLGEIILVLVVVYLMVFKPF